MDLEQRRRILRNSVFNKAEKDLHTFVSKYFITDSSSYEEKSQIYKYLFNTSNKTRTVLWNLFCKYFGDEDHKCNPLNRSDFTLEEYDFVDEILRTKKNNAKQYPNYFKNQCHNINKSIVTDCLILTPYNDSLNNLFNK